MNSSLGDGNVPAQGRNKGLFRPTLQPQGSGWTFVCIPRARDGDWYKLEDPWPPAGYPHPTHMPYIPQPPRTGKGRRPIALQDPTFEWWALAIDLAGLSLREGARAVQWPGEKDPRERIRAELRSARRALHQLGVLPWMCFKNGTPPPAWWETREFVMAIRQWQIIASLQRSSRE
jgi:hypothetical protein